MRTLTFGDRTISYDAGLDTINPDQATTGNCKNPINLTRSHI